MNKIRIIGVDEVGRGALAGPVVVAAAIIPAGIVIKNRGLKLKDSKKLTSNQRKQWFDYFKNHSQIKWAIARIYPRTIEKINISKAANRAASRAVLRVLKNKREASFKIFLDGGLYLSQKIMETDNFNIFCCRTITRGDEKITAIKIASIVAKVWRDKLMIRLAKKYPQYGFDIHKGYGTKKHFEAIRKYGLTDIHRRTFLSFL